MYRTDTAGIVSTGTDSPSSFAPTNSIHRVEGEAAMSFTGFNVNEDQKVRLETKALARAIINRKNGDAERNALLQERQSLLDKRFSGTMTQSDRNRYDYVLWTLDQIEDARHGAALDRLEESIIRYESFLDGVGQLSRDVERASLTSRRR